MASLHTSAMASHSIGVLRPPSAGIYGPRLFITLRHHNCTSHLDLRSRKQAIVQEKNRWVTVCASNSNPSDGSDDKKTSDAVPGPPFLTILAGVVVFLLLCWIIVSIVTWLISLILNPPPLK